jgi:hypothetical protein
VLYSPQLVFPATKQRTRHRHQQRSQVEPESLAFMAFVFLAASRQFALADY